jgi:3-hydroxyisobutyrate dehydrogenase-like beta-hydroxyacid dehydrogenase
VGHSEQRIGLIGVGAMGAGMAKNLLAKGFEVTILGHRNRAPVETLKQQGAAEGNSPADVAQRCDVVILCVADTPQVESIVYGAGGLMEAARQGLIVVDCTTSEPASTARIARDFEAKGASFADAPLARTPKEAEEGRLNVMVGAEPEVFTRIEPVLKAFAENIFHVGGTGAGHKMKLVYNFLTMGQAALIAEALTAAASAGIELEAFCKVVSAGGANSGIFQMLAPATLEGRYDGLNFGLNLARKDLRYYTHQTEQLGLPSIMGEAVHQSFVIASALGFEADKVGALVAAQEKITGTAVGKR